MLASRFSDYEYTCGRQQCTAHTNWRINHIGLPHWTTLQCTNYCGSPLDLSNGVEGHSQNSEFSYVLASVFHAGTT